MTREPTPSAKPAPSRDVYSLAATLIDALKRQDERLLSFGRAVYQQLGRGAVTAWHPSFGPRRSERRPDVETVVVALRVLDHERLADEITALAARVDEHLEFRHSVCETLDAGGVIVFDVPAGKAAR